MKLRIPIIAILVAILCSLPTLFLPEAPEARAETPLEHARRVNKVAQAQYSAGAYEAALALFKEAQLIYPDPKIFYNLGQTYRKLDRNEEALDAFRAYLEGVPGAANRKKVQDTIAELDALLHPKKPEPEPPPPPPPVPVAVPAPASQPTHPVLRPVVSPPVPASPVDGEPDAHPGRTRRIVGLAIGGAGIIGLGISTAFAISARSKWNDAKPDCNAENVCGGKGYQLNQDARSEGNKATAAFILGAAAIGGGAVLYFTAPSDRPREPAASLVPVVTGNGIGLVWSGTY